MRFPKLFARCSLRTILTAAPTHTPCIAHRARSCSLPSLLHQRGRPSISIFSLESLLFREIISSPLAVPKIVCSLFTSHNFDRCASSAQSYANRFFTLFKKLIAPLCFLSPKKLRFSGTPFLPVSPTGRGRVPCPLSYTREVDL